MIVVLVFAILSERWLRKKFKIDKPKRFVYRSVNTFQKWIERTIIIAFLISLWFVDHTLPLLIAFFLVLTSFRTFMEWKYEREKKEYIITLFSIFLYLLIFGLAFYFNFI